MNTPNFLTLDEALALQADQIARYGGAAGTRDQALLESALAMPSTGFGGVPMHPTVIEMAAAYLFHLVKNHPFVDGNKRIGLSCALAFLGLNDLELVATEDQVVDLIIDVASSVKSKAEVAAFLRAHTRPWVD